MRVAGTVVVALVVLGSGCRLKLLPSPLERPWLEVETPHFSLAVPGDEARARGLAIRLERVRETLLAGPWSVPTNSQGTVEVLLLEPEDLPTYLPHGVDGLTLEDPLGRLVVVGDTSPWDNQTINHELAHVVAHPALRRAPLWLEEGLAYYLTTLELGPEGADLGLPDEGLRQLAVRETLDLRRLFASDRDTYFTEGQAQRSFVAQAWILVHLLVSRYPGLLDRYLARLASAEEPRAAWAACCAELTPERLAEETHELAFQGRFPVRRVARGEARAVPLRVRPLALPEVKARLARLLALQHGMDRTAAALAERLAGEALREAPGQPRAAMALCTLRGLASPACQEVAAAAADANPGDGAARLLAMISHWGPGERFRAEVRAVAGLVPEDPMGLLGQAGVHLLEGHRPEGVAEVRRAAEAAPNRYAVQLMAASLMVTAGDCEAARALSRRARDAVADSLPAALARSLRERALEQGTQCERRQPVPARRLACAQAAPQVRSRGRRPPPLQPVTVRFRVLEDGAVADLAPAPGPPADQVKAVLEYLRGCRYAPATVEGTPVATEHEVTFSPAH